MEEKEIEQAERKKTEIIREANEKAKAIIDAAYAELERILDGGFMMDRLNEKLIQLNSNRFDQLHKGYCIEEPDDYKESIAGYKKSIREIESDYAEMDWFPKDNNYEGAFVIRYFAINYFKLAYEVELSNVLKNGIWSAEMEVVSVKGYIEHVLKKTGIKFNEKYIELKINLLNATYYMKKKQAERQERAKEEKARMAEERRAQKEYERELKRAQKDEETARDALKRARQLADVEAEGSAERNRLQAKIEKLEQALQEAQSRADRAQSMAQQTRCGYVYVISNIGSFGEGVYKIGMTRRLDPMERVTELGDASVPFPFDVHAMIYSEDAPALETALHRAFERKKLNMVNGRKEFFRVSLEEIKRQVSESGIDAEFMDEPMAQQWRDSRMFAEDISRNM